LAALHAQDTFSGVRHIGSIGQRHRRHIPDRMRVAVWLSYSVGFMAGVAVDAWYVVPVIVVAPFILAMKPVPVWQPTHSALPGSRVVTRARNWPTLRS
jgi:hypothetical protein